MNHHSRLVTLVLIALVFLLMLAGGGCGKKGDPRFTGSKAPEPISDLRADLEEGVPLLQWTGGWKDSATLRFKILRSGLRSGDCVECPHEFSEIEERIGGELLKEKVKSGTWCYRDITADKGGTYVYRVVVCDRSGNCSEPSNPVTNGKK